MNKYEVLGVVGEGAYGIVLRCRNKESGDIVAIKQFKESDDDEILRKTTLREVKILKMLRHNNIVSFLEAFRRKTKLYLVFEYVEKNLLEVLEEQPQGLDQEVVRSYIFQLTHAIHWCHTNSIIHRDIKPENLLINLKSQCLKLCDFGFARHLTHSTQDLTDYVATRWYRAPELLLGSTNYTYSVDIWAIGCIMGEISDGQPLFPGESEIDQLYLVQRIIGALTPEHLELFMSNPRFAGLKFPDMTKPETLQKKYMGKLQKRALNFMRAIMCMEPTERLLSGQCLADPYFEGMSIDNSNDNGGSGNQVQDSSSGNLHGRDGVITPTPPSGGQANAGNNSRLGLGNNNNNNNNNNNSSNNNGDNVRTTPRNNGDEKLTDAARKHNGIPRNRESREKEAKHAVNNTSSNGNDSSNNAGVAANNLGGDWGFAAADQLQSNTDEAKEVDKRNFPPLNKSNQDNYNDFNDENNKSKKNQGGSKGPKADQQKEILNRKEVEREIERERERQRELEIRAFREFSTKLPIKQQQQQQQQQLQGRLGPGPHLNMNSNNVQLPQPINLRRDRGPSMGIEELRNSNLLNIGFNNNNNSNNNNQFNFQDMQSQQNFNSGNYNNFNNVNNLQLQQAMLQQQHQQFYNKNQPPVRQNANGGANLDLHGNVRTPRNLAVPPLEPMALNNVGAKLRQQSMGQGANAILQNGANAILGNVNVNNSLLHPNAMRLHPGQNQYMQGGIPFGNNLYDSNNQNQGGGVGRGTGLSPRGANLLNNAQMNMNIRGGVGSLAPNAPFQGGGGGGNAAGQALWGGDGSYNTNLGGGGNLVGGIVGTGLSSENHIGSLPHIGGGGNNFHNLDGGINNYNNMLDMRADSKPQRNAGPNFNMGMVGGGPGGGGGGAAVGLGHSGFDPSGLSANLLGGGMVSGLGGHIGNQLYGNLNNNSNNNINNNQQQLHSQQSNANGGNADINYNVSTQQQQQGNAKIKNNKYR